MKLQYLFFILLFISCTPKLLVQQHSKSYLPLEPHESFILFGMNDTTSFDRDDLLGEITIKDKGIAINCDFESVKNLAKVEAKKMGGNCFLITEHKIPDLWSTCHRIKGNVFRIKNVRDYEREILWYPNRKLEILDFKGPTEKRPFLATTASSFKFVTIPSLLSRKFKVKVETYFDCYASYFKHSEFDSLTLAHEQLHFDISELYARKFLERVENEVHSHNEMMSKYQIILDEIGKVMQLKQDEYDSEVYQDKSLQNKWKKLIENELNLLKKYENKDIEISMH